MRLPARIGRRGLDDRLSNWTVYEKDYSDEFEKGWLVTERVIERLSRQCRRNDAELIVLAAPMQIEVDADWRRNILERLEVDESRFDFDKPYRRLEAFCEAHDIGYLYPLAEFVDGVDHRELFFPKDGHPNQFGHALTARALLRHLSEGHHLPYQITGADRGILADL